MDAASVDNGEIFNEITGNATGITAVMGQTGLT
jgi:hypothetical protein